MFAAALGLLGQFRCFSFFPLFGSVLAKSINTFAH
jgi:hypothetical protein